MNLSELLTKYETRNRGRATGGLRALSGFDYQLRLYLAHYVQALATGSALEDAGISFANGLESLSDFTSSVGSSWICVQAKRTLTRASATAAAAEFAIIEQFLIRDGNLNDSRLPHYGLVGQRTELPASFSWNAINLSPDTTRKHPDLVKIWRRLRSQQRVNDPQVEPDPWWAVIVATFDTLDRPLEFARRALEICLRRSELSAHQIRDRIAELFTEMRRSTRITNPRVLTSVDFQLEETEFIRPLRVGFRPSLALFRDRQYMPRPIHVRSACSKLEHLLDLRDRRETYGIQILWITGRSGCGKSVLLLHLMEDMVSRGRRAIWLEDDAANMGNLLEAFSEELNSTKPELPEILFLDDAYAPQNQHRLDLGRIERFVASHPFGPWPVLVTCGPPEFRKRLERDASGGSIRFHNWKLPLVRPSEANQFKTWYRSRTGEQPHTGTAFEQTENLMVSMAFELRFEKHDATLDPFAKRFKERLRASKLDEPLRIPLALNRLYLGAPAAWLTEPVREQFEVLNKERDFSVLELSATRTELLRLTHPHISDAIYRAVREPDGRRAFANDLADALRMAATTHVPTLRHLFRTLTAFDERVQERLKDVDLEHLAARAAADWLAGGFEYKLDSEALADVQVSWACWDARYPHLSIDALRKGEKGQALQKARQALQDVDTAWPFLWRRLDAAVDGHHALATDAIAWLLNPVSQMSRSWSFIWERVWTLSQLHPSWIDGEQLIHYAFKWLQDNGDKPDWHYVWKALLAANTSGEETARVGWSWVTATNDKNDRWDHPSWTYAWKDLLDKTHHLIRDQKEQLLRHGRDWLIGHNDHGEWPSVWRRLLKENTLPSQINRDSLLRLGHEWLTGHGDHVEWPAVWHGLLEEANLPQQIDRDSLLLRANEWLSGREDNNAWGFIWRRLLEEWTLPAVINREKLLRQGEDWLHGHERVGSNAVLRYLLSTVDAQRRAELLRRWLMDLRNRDSRTWGKRLEQFCDEGGTDEFLIARGAEWILRNPDDSRSPPLAAKLLCTTGNPSQLDNLAQWLSIWISDQSNSLQLRLVVSFHCSTRVTTQETAELRLLPGWSALLHTLTQQPLVDPVVFEGLKHSRDLLWNGRSSDALLVLRGLSQHAKNAYDWYALSVYYGKARSHDEARFAAETAVRLEPQNVESLRNLAIAWDHIVGGERHALDAWHRAAELTNTAGSWHTLSVDYRRAGYLEEAIAAARRAVSLDPDHIEAWIHLARNLSDVPGHLHEALSIRSEIAQVTNTATHWFALSLAYEEVGRHEEAVAVARNAIAMEPENIEAWLSLSRNLANLPDTLKEALDALDQIARLADTGAHWYSLSVAYGKLSRHQEAITAARNAITLEPEHIDAWHSLSRNLAHVPGHLEEKLNALDQMAQWANTASDWYALSVGYGKVNRHGDAVQAARNAIALEPEHIEAWNSLARNLSNIPGHLEEALGARNQVSQLANTAHHSYNLSLAYEETGRHEEAVSAARNAIALEPEHTEAWLCLSRNLANLPDTLEETLSVLDQIVHLANTAAHWYPLSVAYGRMGRHADAVKAARNAIALEPSHIEAWLSLSRNLPDGSGDLGEKLDALNQTAQLANTASHWYALSVGYGKMNHHEEAVKAARNAITLEPEHTEAWNSLSRNLSQLPGHLEEALSARNQVAQLENTASCWYNLSVAYEKHGLYDEAIDAADKAIALDQSQVQAWRARARCIEQAGRSYEESVAAWRIVEKIAGTAAVLTESEALLQVQTHPGSPEAWKSLARTYHRAGRASEAVLAAQNAVRGTPTIAKATMPLAKMLLSLVPQAVASLMEDLVALDQQDGYRAHLLGAARRKAGNIDGAVDPLRTACTIDPTCENYWYALGRAFADLERVEDARTAFEKALELKPDYKKARRALERLLAREKSELNP